MRRVRISEKLGDYRRLGNDLPIVRQAGHEASRVDREVFGGARGGEVNNFFLKGKAQFFEDNVGAMGPYSSVN